MARPRARSLGIVLDGTPGALNAITDVAGVAIGHVTWIEGEGPGTRGRGPVRTGVTALLTRPRGDYDAVFAARAVLNGTGELTGTALIDEVGRLYGPIMLTNTNSVGVVRDATTAWLVDNDPDYLGALPVVGETWDGVLNDICGFHVKAEHARTALESATPGPVEQGCVGAGTGTVAYGYKGGIGTSSRVAGPFVVGALVQANHGLRHQLTIAGVPVGRRLPAAPAELERGSIIVVIATDAPLLPHQLARVARRGQLGLARTGSTSGPYSGDFFLAFSTANRPRRLIPPASHDADPKIVSVDTVADEHLQALFEATVEATEEAIIDALITAEEMTGFGGTVEALPADEVAAMLNRPT
jgi:D-aminopeptidase